MLLNEFNDERILLSRSCLSIISSGPPRAALFMDRDGVVITDVNYIKSISDVKLEKGILPLLSYSYNSKVPIILITNQSGISRNYSTWEDYNLVTDQMLRLIGKENPIEAIYANSHGPSETGLNWRKPNPLMISTASSKLNIDLARSILIGDRLTDLQAGCRASLSKVIHVLTGHGFKERKNVLNSLDQIGNFRCGDQSSDFLQISSLDELPLSIIDSLA